MSENAPEEWRPVVGYEGLYEVSDQGRVLSYHSRHPRVLTPVRTGRGYPGVNLFRSGKGTRRVIHRMVKLAFDPVPGHEHLFVLHRDGEMENNTLWNLKWGTHEENMKDMLRHGTSANQNTRKTQCDKGHWFSPDNTYTNRKGARVCRECHRNYSREYNAKIRRRNKHD